MKWLLAFLLCIAAPLGAQLSRSADATATVTIPAQLTLVNVTGLDFGSHFASEGIIIAPTPAQWSGTTDRGNTLSFAFTLPPSLGRVGGGGNGPVPITFGTTSARVTSPEVNQQSFNPATGLPSFAIATSGDGSFQVFLGGTSNPADRVTVDLSSRLAGTYQATITLTVVIL